MSESADPKKPSRAELLARRYERLMSYGVA